MLTVDEAATGRPRSAVRRELKTEEFTLAAILSGDPLCRDYVG